MVFVIDAGNSNTVLGLYDGDELRAHWRVVTTPSRTGDELRILFSLLLGQAGTSPQAVTGCCVGSVVPPLNPALLEACQASFGFEPLFIGPGIKTGLVLQVENPKEVGADRIANAVAARETLEGPLAVVDFGTATTIDVVTEQGEYRGGVIFPGIQISADALFERCAKLPRVDISAPGRVIGRDTVTNIRAGLTYGYADMVDGLLGRIAEELGSEPTVVATGGYAPLISGLSRRVQCVDLLLTLKGLNVLYRRNAKAPA